MISERYLFRGKRLDNGEWIEGGIAYDHQIQKPVIMTMSESPKFVAWDVDPDTIEPVAVPVVVKNKEYRCPNCNAWFYTVARKEQKLVGTTPYCGNCGQRLDWEKSGKRELEMKL